MTVRIVVLTSPHDTPPGHDSKSATALIEGTGFGGMIAEAASGANRILERRRAGSVIEQRPGRAAARHVDRHVCRWHDPIEDLFREPGSSDVSQSDTTMPTGASRPCPMPVQPS